MWGLTDLETRVGKIYDFPRDDMSNEGFYMPTNDVMGPVMMPSKNQLYDIVEENRMLKGKNRLLEDLQKGWRENEEDCTMEVGGVFVCGIVRVIFCVKATMEDGFLVCQIRKKDARKWVVLREKTLYTKRLLKELKRAGMDIQPFPQGVLESDFLDAISRKLRDEAQKAKIIPFNAGYDEDNFFQYCDEAIAKKISTIKEIPAVKKYLAKADAKTFEFMDLLNVFQGVSFSICSVLIFLMYQPLVVSNGKFPFKQDVDTLKIRISASTEVVKKIMRSLIYWGEKDILCSFKDREIKEKEKMAETENIAILPSAINQYEKKCIEKNVSNYNKAGVNFIIACKNSLPNIDFDGEIILPETVEVGTLPTGYYTNFITWLNERENPFDGIDELCDQKDSMIQRQAKYVVTVLKNFFSNAKDEQMWEEFAFSFVENVTHFFEEENARLDIAEKFKRLFAQSHFKFKDIEAYADEDEKDVAYRDEGYIYLQKRTFKEIIKPLTRHANFDYICNELHKNNILSREKRGESGYYLTTKVSKANCKRLVKLCRKSLLARSEEFYYGDSEAFFDSGVHCLEIGKNEEEKTVRILYDKIGEELSNLHVLFTGMSGNGKTYAMKTMLTRTGMPALVFDYAQGFRGDDGQNNWQDDLLFLDVDKIQIPLFRVRTHNGKKEGKHHYASRVSETLKKLYRFGKNQISLIREYAEMCCKQDKEASFAGICQYEKWYNRANKKNVDVASKLLHWNDAPCFSEDNEKVNWAEILSKKQKIVFTYGGDYLAEEKVFLTEILLSDLLSFCEERGPSEERFIVVLDEVQRLSFAHDMALVRFLTEGRKFGVAVWTATQSLALISTMGDREKLLQAPTRLQFKPDERELEQMRKQKSEETQKMKRMNVGECFVSAKFVRNDGKITEQFSQFVKIK